jgi:hypothetical protein
MGGSSKYLQFKAAAQTGATAVRKTLAKFRQTQISNSTHFIL